MKTIYIFTPGTVLRRVGRRLLLEKKSERLFEIPLKDIGRILIYGRTEVTAQTINALLERDIPLYFVRRSGALKGKLVAGTNHHIMLRQRQHLYFNDPRASLPLARAIVHNKIQNMRSVVMYLLHRQQGTKNACQPFLTACRKLPACHSREEIMGVEGAAAAHYFRIYGQHLPSALRFQVRSRRPAHDPANALLNLGYMTLLREIEAHLEAHHLDPYLGILHAPQDRRPSLALDLLEQFRQPLIDLFVMRLFKRQELTAEHFQYTDQNGVLMTDEGLRKFFQLYEQKLGCLDGDQPGTRKIIDEQVQLLKKHLLGQAHYPTFVLELSPQIQFRDMRQSLWGIN